LKRLNKQQLNKVQAVLEVIELEIISADEIQKYLENINSEFLEIRHQNTNLQDLRIADIMDQGLEIISAPTLDAKHKIKLTIPIIPMLLEYEGEIELGSGANLEALWKQLLSKILRR
jgi:hypothetical protein